MIRFRIGLSFLRSFKIRGDRACHLTSILGKCQISKGLVGCQQGFKSSGRKGGFEIADSKIQPLGDKEEVKVDRSRWMHDRSCVWFIKAKGIPAVGYYIVWLGNKDSGKGAWE